MLGLEIENHVNSDDLKGLDARVNCDITRYWKSDTLWISKLLGDTFNMLGRMMFALRQRLEHMVTLRVGNGAEMIMEQK